MILFSLFLTNLVYGMYGIYTPGLFDNAKESINTRHLSQRKLNLFRIISQDNSLQLRANSYARHTSNATLGNYTLLTFAVASSSSKCAQTLITLCHANVNALDDNKLCPLVYALKHENWQLAQFLFDHGASVNLLQGEGFWDLRPPLWIFFRAIYGGNYIWHSMFTKQIEWLLRHGANPSMFNDDSIPLIEVHTISDKKISTALTKLLCESGADIRERAYGHKTILHHLVQRRKSESFECQILTLHYLLQAGADINAQDENFYTPLHKAVICNEENETSGCRGAERTNADCIAYLLYKGADPELKNWYWQKPIYYARQPEVIAMLENPKSVVLSERVKAILDPLKVPCKKIP